MLRILVYSENAEAAQQFHGKVWERLRCFGIKCELAFSDKTEQLTGSDAKAYDIYFIDVKGEKGCRLAADIRRKSLIPSIVFLCEPRKIPDSLLRYRPSGLLFDTDNTEKLTDLLKWCCSEQMKAHPYFSVKNRDVQMKIDYDSISYFESRQRIVSLHTTKQVIEFYAKLGEVFSLLPASDFVRCHQSYIVNMGRVRELDKVNRAFRMLSGITIDISKSYYPEAVARYEKYISEH